MYIKNDFIVESLENDGVFGVFEDDGEAGYLYLYEPDGRGMLDDLQIYSDSSSVGINQDDIEVVWSENHKKCGVKIWGKIFGVIDVITGEKTKVKITDKNTLPIPNSELIREFPS